jgi:carotenoid 1,2-hydratase
VALYSNRRKDKGWAMTERGAATLHRTAQEFAIGPSSLCWNGDTLTISINERTMPFGHRLRGVVRVKPQALAGRTFALDSAGIHRWSPMAPRAHVDVIMDNPGLSWRGTGYLDSNDGDAPLEDSFASWHWSRAGVGNDTVIFYDVVPRQGPEAMLALGIDKTGEITPFEPPPRLELHRTRWGVRRITRGMAGQARVLQTLEDTPFYARSILDVRMRGQITKAVHESLSLARFQKSWVQAMLPFRMPRRIR